MKKVIFLDVDGVLNSRKTFVSKKGKGPWLIDVTFVRRLNRILQETGASIVLSSVWRKYEKGRKKVKEYVDFIEWTPQHDSRVRGLEIQLWLDKHPDVTRYAIIDDDADMLEGQPLFQTSFDEGLTEEITQKVIDFLNK